MRRCRSKSGVLSGVIVGLAAMLLSCGPEVGRSVSRVAAEIKKGAKTERKSDPILIYGDDKVISEERIDSSDAAFRLTVYPLLVSHCAACHASVQAPFFAAPDAVAAHKVTIDTGKVDLIEVGRSRLVKRLVDDNHQCWGDCAENAKTMATAIKAWDAKIPAGVRPKIANLRTSALTYERRTDPVQLSMAGDLIIREGESATLTRKVSGTDAEASGNTFIQVPAAGGGPLAANNNNAGIAVINNLVVTTAGTFNLWIRARAAAETNDEIYVRVLQGATVVVPSTIWKVPVSGNRWVWSPATNGPNLSSVLEFTLAPGTYAVELRQRESGFQIDKVALSGRPGFSGDEPVKVLRFDISDLTLVPGTFFDIEMEDYDPNVYKFKNPRILSNSRPVRVIGVAVLVNGNSDVQNATYRLIDQVVPQGGAVLSRAAMTVVKDKGAEADEIEFLFDRFERP